MKVKSYKELIVWQKAMQLVRVVYDATDQFPKYERFALADQLVRAVVSVPAGAGLFGIIWGEWRKKRGKFP